MSISELETPQFSSFVGTDGVELSAVRFLSERTAPALAWPTAVGGDSIRYANGWLKRAFDLVVGSVVSILTAPIMVLLAVGSAVSFRSWPFFVQKRLGRDGRLFCFIKVRSLPPDTPVYADKYEVEFVTNTRWGNFLRNSHLDELPQFWLVVTGRMSLIGPRPEMPELASTFDAAFVRERLAVRPGITGPWQVSTASAMLIGEAPELDRLYLARAGPRLETWVSLRTIGGLVGLQPLPFESFPKWAAQSGAAARRKPGLDRSAQSVEYYEADGFAVASEA